MALEQAWLFLKAGAPPPAWTLPANQSIDGVMGSGQGTASGWEGTTDYSQVGRYGRSQPVAGSPVLPIQGENAVGADDLSNVADPNQYIRENARLRDGKVMTRRPSSLYGSWSGLDGFDPMKNPNSASDKFAHEQQFDRVADWRKQGVASIPPAHGGPIPQDETTPVAQIESTRALDSMADNREADRLVARANARQRGLDAIKRPGFLEGLTSAGRKRWKDWFNTWTEGGWKVGGDRVQARRLRGTAPDWRKDMDEDHARRRDLPGLYETRGDRGLIGRNRRLIQVAPRPAVTQGGFSAVTDGHGVTTDEPASTFAEEYPTRYERTGSWENE